MNTQEWLVHNTAEKIRQEEIAFRNEEVRESISDILARQKQKENLPKLLKEIRE
jgi:hypothetical protein